MPTGLSIVQRFYPDVEKVKNGTKALTIEVTPADVRAGAKQDHKECAVARACKRALKADAVLVSRGKVYVIKGDEAWRYQIPQSLSREIVAFDKGGAFSPGEYTLHKPEPVAPRGAGTRHTGDPKPGNRAPYHLTAGVRAKLIGA